MSLTETEIEDIADRLRQCGFDLSDTSKDQIALMVQCVVEALNLEVSE